MTATESIIVGAGPAGLACAATLRMRGREAVVLEQSDTLAASWHRHYDRLHLHTHKMHSALPGQPMPKDFPKYPSRLQVIDYLEDYARMNLIDVRFRAKVNAIRPGNSWTVDSDAGRFEAKNVIVATGLANTPARPTWDGQDSFPGKLLHSSEYRNAAELAAERVLVVGFGNSAGEIALECAEAGLHVGLSVRSPVNVIPLEMFGLPAVSIAIAQQYLPYRMVDAMNAPFLRMRFGDISKYGLEWAPEGPVTTIMERSQTPLINIGTMDRIKSGDIQVYRGISKSEGSRVSFADGGHDNFDAIVLATGYRPALETMLPDCAERFGGTSGPARGQLHPGNDGLYFCGFSVVPTGLLREIGKEARQIAAAIDKT